MNPRDPSETADFPNAARLQNALIHKLLREETLTQPNVEAAFRAVPRHHFLPQHTPEEAYKDRAIPTKMDGNLAISSSSQPAIMAIMLEQLALKPGMKVLEIGAGTGYNAALMGHIVGPLGHVTTIDIDQDIVDNARTHLASVGADNVTVICGDGTVGFAANAPYDRLILTVGGWDIPPAWTTQLKENGRLLLPLSFDGPQLAVCFIKQGNQLHSDSVAPCGFMRLRGNHAEPRLNLPLTKDDSLWLELYHPQFAPTAQTARGWLAQPATLLPTGIHTTMGAIWNSWSLWHALHLPNHAMLSGVGNSIPHVPPLLEQKGENGWRASSGMVAPDGLALLRRDPPAGGPTPGQFALTVCSFGPNEMLGQQLVAAVQQWAAQDKPTGTRMKIAALPLETAVSPTPNCTILKKKWRQYIVSTQKQGFF